MLHHARKYTIIAVQTTVFVLVFITLSSGVSPATPQFQGPSLTRDEIIDTARRMAEHHWVAHEDNLQASCVANYESDWTRDSVVTGIAYDWGGMDDTEQFDRKLSQGQAAGSHSWHGVTQCTAGTDCSGFVSLCWGSTRKYGTSTIENQETGIAVRPRYNWFTDLKPGDALNKPGSHIVLFANYRADGNPNVYEASGSAGRVIYNDWSTWARYRDYHAIQYRNVVDP